MRKRASRGAARPPTGMNAIVTPMKMKAAIAAKNRTEN